MKTNLYIANLRLMRRKYASLQGIALLIFMLFACAEEDTQQTPADGMAPLTHIAARAGSMTGIYDGKITLTIDDRKAHYKWNHRDKFILDTDENNDRLLVGSGEHDADVAGIVKRMEILIGLDTLPVTYKGKITTIVATDGSSAAIKDNLPIPLSIATARIGVKITRGAFGETAQQMKGTYFTARMAPGIKLHEDASKLPVWIQPLVSWSRCNIAAQTVEKGTPLLTLTITNTNPDDVYHGLTFTITPDADLELKAGHQYTLNIALDAGGRAAVVTTEIEPYGPGDLGGLAIKKKGIATADDLIAFSQDCENGTADKWFDDNDVVHLLNDIDMTGKAGIADINNFNRTFDGGGHTISNLMALNGLFYSIAPTGKVYALHLDGLNLMAPNSTACFTQRNSGIIAGCSVSGQIEGPQIVGGIAVNNIGTIAGCSVDLSQLKSILHGAIIVEDNNGKITGCTYNEDANGQTFGPTISGNSPDNTTPLTTSYPTRQQIVNMNNAIAALTGNNAVPVKWVYINDDTKPLQLLIKPTPEP